MSLTISCSITALAPGLETSFAASGGEEPYVFSVVPGGAGGSIGASTGIYTAPAAENPNPKLSSDVIRVTDANDDTADYPLLVTGPLGLLCEILQKELALDPGRVYLWDQKINQPSDAGLYIAVSVLTARPFANTVRYDASEDALGAVQSLNMMATLSLDVISRSNAALMRKEEVLMALASPYSESQQEANSFSIGRLPPGSQFVNLSMVDGAAIPYRFNISVNMQYFARKLKAVPYFDDFADPAVTTEP